MALDKRLGGGLVPDTAYTPTAANTYKRAGRWHSSPAVGDLAFFDFPDSTTRIQHVGVVESFTDTTVTCIEGNTSPGSTGSQDNGGGVYRRTRPRTHVVGFGRPAYTEDQDMTPDQEAKLDKLLGYFEARGWLTDELEKDRAADAARQAELLARLEAVEESIATAGTLKVSGELRVTK